MRITHIVTAMSLSIILAATLVLPPLLVAAPQKSTVVHDQVRNKMFTDVSVAHPNFDAIYFGYNTGFVEGYGAEGQRARQYKPDQLINRAEFLKVVMEGTGQTNLASSHSCFPDVPANEWFAPYVCQAKQKGWIGGYPDGRFRPEQTINEAEALKILSQIQALQVSTPDPGEPWYAGYREVGDERNIIPTDDLSSQMDRGDVMEMVYRNTMVDDLKIQKFNEKYTDELMDEHDIAYDGVLGPGGAFGPGGAGGNAGVGIAFADETVTPEQTREENLVEPVEAAYFALHPCYYSDAGDFSDLVIPSLERMTGGNVSALKLAGYDMTGFGTLFCHDREIETDLKRLDLDEAARNGFELTCWRDPVYSPSKDGSSEQIFCYVQDHAPKRDTYCEVVPDDRGQICEVCYNDVIERTETSRSCGDSSSSADRVSASPPVTRNNIELTDLCALLDPKTGQPYGASQEPPLGQAAPPANPASPPIGPHVVKPIDQGNENICLAAAVYSSLRLLEDELGIHAFIQHGRPGLDDLINALYSTGATARGSKGQMDALVKWVQVHHPGCLWAGNNNKEQRAITCATLRNHTIGGGCDVPISFSCQSVDAAGNPVASVDAAGNPVPAGKWWGHAVDLTRVTIDPNDPHTCRLDFANSWHPAVGAGEDLDGLGAGRYESAEYNDTDESFVPQTPWGAGLRCIFLEAARICVDNIEACQRYINPFPL